MNNLILLALTEFCSLASLFAWTICLLTLVYKGSLQLVNKKDVVIIIIIIVVIVITVIVITLLLSLLILLLIKIYILVDKLINTVYVFKRNTAAQQYSFN